MNRKVSVLLAIIDLHSDACNLSTGQIDLEAKFEPSLLNTAIYLLGLSQQVSTFTINFQVRQFHTLRVLPTKRLAGSAIPRRHSRKRNLMVGSSSRKRGSIFWGD